MKTVEATILTRYELVRGAYSQDAVWREALGNSARLRPFVTFECGIDAPEYLPTGSAKPDNWFPRVMREPSI